MNRKRSTTTAPASTAADPRADLDGRLAAARARLDEIGLAKRRLALRVAGGDSRAMKRFDSLEAEAVSQRTGIEILTLAIDVLNEQQAEKERQLQERRQAEAAKRQSAFLDVMEAEQRQHIEANIRRLDACGDRAHADIWRAELPKIRQRLEAQSA